MKLYLPLLAAAFLSVSCSSVPRSTITYAPPSVTGVRTSVSEAQTSIDKATVHTKRAKVNLGELAKDKALTDGMRMLLKAADEDLDRLTLELLVTQAALQSAQTKINELEGKVNSQTDTLNRANDMRNAAIDAKEKVTRKYHRLKFVACSIGAALVGFLAFKFKSLAFALGPWGALLLFGAPAAAFAALWMIL